MTDKFSRARSEKLVTCYDHCCRAFEAFQALVEEQIAAIVAVEGGSTAASGGRAPDPD
jgi:hypothetical protein